jgi:hypothetical protein
VSLGGTAPDTFLPHPYAPSPPWDVYVADAPFCLARGESGKGGAGGGGRRDSSAVFLISHATDSLFWRPLGIADTIAPRKRSMHPLQTGIGRDKKVNFEITCCGAATKGLSPYFRQPAYSTMENDLTGKFAIVTGASLGGIGWHTAEKLVSRGAHVTIGMRHAGRAAAALAAIKARHPRGKIDSIQLDMSDLDSVNAFVQLFRLSHGE